MLFCPHFFACLLNKTVYLHESSASVSDTCEVKLASVLGSLLLVILCFSNLCIDTGGQESGWLLSSVLSLLGFSAVIVPLGRCAEAVISMPLFVCLFVCLLKVLFVVISRL